MQKNLSERQNPNLSDEPQPRDILDGEIYVLEDQLNDIATKIFHLVEERRQIENAIQFEKRKIIQKKELECRSFLENISAQWRKAAIC